MKKKRGPLTHKRALLTAPARCSGVDQARHARTSEGWPACSSRSSCASRTSLADAQPPSRPGILMCSQRSRVLPGASHDTRPPRGWSSEAIVNE